MSKLNSNYIGWDTKNHLIEFNSWNKKCNLDFNYTYGSFSEQKYLLSAIRNLENPKIVDIGCATGTTYRYLKNKLGDSGYSYTGIDISSHVIKKAESLYPNANFIESTEDEFIKILGSKVDIVYSRDLVLHQEDPYEFLNQLIDITDKFLIIRLRTKDEGETEFDISKSCQMHYDLYWMPYIVLNIDELIAYFKSKDNVAKILINKSYEVLGGQNNRFLPQDLYFKKSKTAETSIMIEFNSDNQAGNLEIVYDKEIQGREFLKMNKWSFKNLIYRLMSKIALKNIT